MEKTNSSGSVLEFQMATQGIALARAMNENKEVEKQLEIAAIAIDEVIKAFEFSAAGRLEAAKSFEWLLRWAGEIFQDDEAEPHVRTLCKILGTKTD